MSFFNRKRQYLVGSVILLLLGTWPSCAEEPVRLTSDGRLKATPVFTQGGTELVFAVLENPKLALQDLSGLVKVAVVEPLAGLFRGKLAT